MIFGGCGDLDVPTTSYLEVVFYGHANERDVSSIRIERLIGSDL